MNFLIINFYFGINASLRAAKSPRVVRPGKSFFLVYEVGNFAAQQQQYFVDKQYQPLPALRSNLK
jgi:hypothetical protein